jgi:hypothetical protein
MALVGSPQFLEVRNVQWTGSGTSEVDNAGYNGQDKQNGAANGFTAPNVTQTITAGPTTAGPVIVVYNNVVWALPFNVSCSAPKPVFDMLDTGQGWAHA